MWINGENVKLKKKYEYVHDIEAREIVEKIKFSSPKTYFIKHFQTKKNYCSKKEWGGCV